MVQFLIRASQTSSPITNDRSEGNQQRMCKGEGGDVLDSGVLDLDTA